MADEAGIPYAWVDTCCIDKSSSAELTEAINSMYRWYQRSAICYAYLSDLSPSASLDTALSSCRWFTRGWTLQELIAPSEMRFFDLSWVDRGSKECLCDELSRITGIDAKVLRHELPLSSIAVAQRMAWAAKRETTRIEDRSYSLLGIFSVHMPMIYGEEERAFRRLQEEIIKSTLDMSILAWTLPESTIPLDYPETRYICGLLATSPDVFQDCLTVAGVPHMETDEFSLSNKGIKSSARCGLVRHFNVLSLRCSASPEMPIDLCILVKRCGSDQFIRHDPWKLHEGYAPGDINRSRAQHEYFLSEVPDVDGREGPEFRPMAPFLIARRYSVLQIVFPVHRNIRIRDVKGWPEGRWDEDDDLFFVEVEYYGGVCVLRFTVYWGDSIFFNYTLYGENWSDGPRELREYGGVDAFRYTITEPQFFYPQACRVPGKVEPEVEQNLKERIRALTIPRTSQCVINRAWGKAGVLSARYSTVEDNNVCHNPFRRLQFDFEYVDIADAPTPVDLGWSWL